jgi:hypothetical protein
MSRRFKFAGKTCVYCAAKPATVPDHIFARAFFLVPRRDNLPQVPACEQCNGAKAKLEHYLASVLPFGGCHQDASENLSTAVPDRLAKNIRLHRELEGGMSNASVGGGGSVMTVPFEPEKLSRLFEYIAKALAWHHWQVLIDGKADVWAGILNATGEALFNSYLAMNARARVDENLGADTFSYLGAQGTDDSQMSVWLFTIYGGLRLCGDPDAPHEQVSKVGVLIASRQFIERFNVLLAGQPSSFTRAGMALRRLLAWLLRLFRRRSLEA